MSLDTALAGGLRSGAVLGADPDGRARDRLAEVLRRRLARVADRGAPGRHRARARPAARPRPAARRLDHRARAAARARRASGRRRDRHADPRHRRRGGAGRARRPRAECRPASRSCPRSSTSSCSTRPIADGSRRPASWPASSPSTSAATPRRPGCCGARAPRRNGYTWGSIAATGAVLAFGTDAPVEPFDPWPGIALAVRREDRALAGRDAGRSARTRR